MSGNRYLIPDRTVLLKNKIDMLSKQLQGSLRSGSFATKEEYLFAATKLVNSFYKDLLEPILELEQILPDTKPDPEIYNRAWNQVLDDLTIVFSELENIETMTLANFNFITTEANRLITRLKAVSSKLGDYILYSTDLSRDALYYKDSFNDLSKVEVLSPLLNDVQCSVDQEQGLATLPIDLPKNKTAIIKESPVINPNSNGVAGNNQEIGRPHKGDISIVLDNNPDTWFEYERVVSQSADTKDPLVLDIVINLGNPQVINYIRINPNNFGTKTIIKIDKIETSKDGKIYTSIKDDIPIAGFLTQDEENVFVLAPSTSKYAGQGIYSFTPREVKYIHLVFQQTEAYVIDTVQGPRLRYAIGIRDIDIRGVAYKSTGEIVSTPFQFASPVKKVVLETNQNPVQLSELATIEYQISPDDGLTWNQIQPKQIAASSGRLDVPEVLNFNSLDADSIDTSAPVFTLRLKAIMKRRDDLFTTDSSSFNKKILTKAEVHTLPTESPFIIELIEAPIIGSVLLVDTMYGSRGLPNSPYIVGFGNRALNQQKYRLPFTLFPRPFKKVYSGGRWRTEPQPAGDWLVVEVGGERWTHITQPMSSYGATDKVFRLNINDGTLEFGNDTNGKTPDPDQLITVYLEQERIFPTAIEDNHKAKLDFTTTANKDDVILKRYDKVLEEAELLPRRTSIIRLLHTDLVDITNIQATINSLPSTSLQVTFQNGKDELTLSNHWSIDTKNGVIYLSTPTPDTTTRAISYTYQPIVTLETTDWDWDSSDIVRDSVKIKESAWSTISINDEVIGYDINSTVLELSQLSVTEGSLTFNVSVSGIQLDPTDTAYPFVKEIKFKDGRQELGNPVHTVIDRIPTLVSGLNTIDFKETIIDDSVQYKVFFTNTDIFATEVFTTPTTYGQYQVIRSTNQYKVYWGVSMDPGKVTYFTTNPDYTDNGLYSVDYVRGKVYTQRPMTTTLWNIKASYTYSDIRAEYLIARIVDTRNYEVDIVNKQILLKDSEVLQRPLIPHTRIDSHDPFYIVNYDYVSETRENIQGLKDFFTPVLKDYMLKVITKGRLP